ncbi:hypothetical protein [Pseudomonas sp. ML96]|uniref:hypothetical protein n=1 Tax=Pseudomonas sp. ML96 TaxID=1523503 RepID=UPI0005B7BC78|nr:hypothetical protein [Pseudomonas sp. ML96]
MKAMLICGGLAACLPLLALADGEISEQLNGLQIETSSSPLTAQDNTGAAGPVTGNATLLLKLTNRDTQIVECVVDPGPTATEPQQQRAQLAPGESATLRVEARAGGQQSDARLTCTPAGAS